MKNAAINWPNLFTGIFVGVVLGVGGGMIAYGQKIAVMQEKISVLEERIKLIMSISGNVQEGKSNPNDAVPSNQEPQANPNDLINLVKEAQRSHVKESYGEEAGQAFTDADLAKFQSDDIPAMVVSSLMRDRHFIRVVIAIQKMDPLSQQELLNSAQKPLRPTWAQLGKISSEGQTDAGQQAEKLIAKSVVEKVSELLTKTPKEIANQYGS